MLNVVVSDNEVDLDVEATTASPLCPSCRHHFPHVHSRFVRQITDQPTRSDLADEMDWTSVESAAGVVAAVLEHVAYGPVGSVGWAAGGRVALALAARHPDLVDRVGVVSVSTPAPQNQVPRLCPCAGQRLEGMRGCTARTARAALRAHLASERAQ